MRILISSYLIKVKFILYFFLFLSLFCYVIRKETYLNQIYVRIVSSIDTFLIFVGTVLRSDVEGSLQVTCQLGGMPQLTLGLNDKVQIDNQIASGKRYSKLEI